MKKSVFPLIGILLLCIVLIYYQMDTKVGGSIQSSKLLDNTTVKWDIKNNEVIVELLDKKDNPITTLDSRERNKVNILAVNNDFTYFEHITSVYNGEGIFEGEFELDEDDVYTFFLYIEGKNISSVLSTFQMKKWEQASILKDTLLNKKIDNLNAILQFPPLFVNERSEITFQLDSDKGKNKLNPIVEEKGVLYIVDEEATLVELIHPEKQISDDKIIFSVVFPKVGIYKLWGEFQWNGKIVRFPYVVQVLERK